MTVNISQLESFCHARSPSDLDCHTQARVYADLLTEEFDIEAVERTGEFLTTPDSDKGSGQTHSWVQIPSYEVSDCPADVIIDPTIQQFGSAEKNNGGIDNITHPHEVAVIPMNSSLGELYIAF